MPRGRMLNKKISQDDKVAKLSIEATLLYTWCIPYLDFRGRIYGDVWTLKSIVPHIEEITPKIIEKCINEWVDADLVIYYGDTQKYLQFKGFAKNQTLRENRERDSDIPAPAELQRNSSGTPAKEKLREVKLSKDNIIKPELKNPSPNVNNSKNSKAVVDKFLGRDGITKLGQKSEQELTVEIQTAWLSKFPKLPLNFGVIKNMLRGKKPYHTVGDLDKQADFILEQIADMPKDLKNPTARLGHTLTRPGMYVKN